MRGLWKFAPLVVLVTAGVALGVSGGAGATGAREPYVNSSLHSTDKDVHFKAGVVKVSRATVQHDLIGIADKTGGTKKKPVVEGVFEFKSASGPLAHVHKGSVVLLQGSNVLMVESVAHKGGKLLLTTIPAELTQLVSSGKFTFNGAPNWKGASAEPVVTGVPSTRKGALVFHAPGYPYVARRGGADRPDAGTFTIQGGSGPFGYSLNFTPDGANREKLSGTICVGVGSICGNGPANGVDAELNLSGFVDFSDLSGGVDVSTGSVTGSDFHIKSLATGMKLTYKVVRADGANENLDPPVLHIPLGVDMTIPGDIPLYVKLQLGVLVKFGLTSKNSVIYGGVSLDTSGSSDNVKLAGKSADGSESGDSANGDFLDASDGGTPPSVNLGPAGIVVAVQFPKIGFGLGWTSLNGLAYVDVITSLGETAPGAIDELMPCTHYVVDYSIGTGFEAQLGGGKLGLAFATPRTVLYPGKNATNPTTTDCASS